MAERSTSFAQQEILALLGLKNGELIYVAKKDVTKNDVAKKDVTKNDF